MNHQRSLKKKGEIGEEMARKYLERKGYRFIMSNFHSRNGEIDLIMWDGEELVFIEVKLRLNTAWGRGEEGVNYYKAKKLSKTAMDYIIKNTESDPFWRIDIISIEKTDSEWKIYHFQDAVRDIY
jgi:putative endonuclease